MHHQGHGRTEGADSAFEVPMAWFWAEYIADELLRTGDLMPPTSVEFRAGREALALTIFLADTEGELSGIRVISQLDTWLSLTAYEDPWHRWVSERFAQLLCDTGPLTHTVADLELAVTSWSWLCDTELLAPDLDTVLDRSSAAGEAGAESAADLRLPGADDGWTGTEVRLPQSWTPAWQLGLPLGHLAIRLF